MPIFFPQVLILLQLRFLNKTYDELRDILVNGISRNMLNYVTNKAHIWNFDSIVRMHKPNQLRGEEEVKKQIKLIFDKSDLIPDSVRRQTMHIWNNEMLMTEYPALRQLSEPIASGDSVLSHAALVDLLLNHQIDVGLQYGDFYST